VSKDYFMVRLLYTFSPICGSAHRWWVFLEQALHTAHFCTCALY